MEDALNEFNAWAPRLVDMGINLLVASVSYTHLRAHET